MEDTRAKYSRSRLAKYAKRTFENSLLKVAKLSRCIVFRVWLTLHLDNCTAKKRRFRKGQLQDSEARAEGSGSKEKQLVSGSTKKSSYKEHRVDALAPYAEEGRGKLRKTTGSRKQALIRRYPNGGTRQSKRLSP